MPALDAAEEVDDVEEPEDTAHPVTSFVGVGARVSVMISNSPC